MPQNAQFLNDEVSIAWLFETHLKIHEHFSKRTKSFIIVGNEDSPNFIELYEQKDPVFGTQPFQTFTPNEKGEFK